MNALRYSLLMISLCIPFTAHAEWAHVQRIPSQDPSAVAGSRFGNSLGADVRFGPNTVRALYVGAPNATATYLGNDYAGAGVVYILSNYGGTWHTVSTMRATAPQVNAHFGAAVAVQNGIIVVGEPDYDNQGHTDAGRVWYFEDYHFNNPNFPEPAISSMTERTVSFDNAHLGASVAVNGSGKVIGGTGSFAAAGAPGLAGVGCVYVNYFAVNQTVEKGSICGAASGDSYGSSVAVLTMDSTQINLVVGAPGESQGGNATAGGAHVAVFSAGTLFAYGDLAAQNPTLFDFFGTSVAIDSHRIYVGASGRDKSGVGRTGSVSLFTPGNIIGYNFNGEIFPVNGAPGDLCGASVSLNQATDKGFAMGCPGSDGLVSGEGSVYVENPIPFLGGTLWIGEELNMADLPHGADDLGRGVVIVADRVYAGSPFANAPGSDDGAVDIFATDALFANGFEN